MSVRFEARSLGYRVMIRLRESEGLPLCMSCLASDIGANEHDIAAALPVGDLLGFERAVWWCHSCSHKRDVALATPPSAPPIGP
jgi:hypothetical protein